MLASGERFGGIFVDKFNVVILTHCELRWETRFRWKDLKEVRFGVKLSGAIVL